MALDTQIHKTLVKYTSKHFTLILNKVGHLKFFKGEFSNLIEINFQASFPINLNVQKFDWVQCDREFSGYYVTNYDQSNWIVLASELNSNPTVN